MKKQKKPLAWAEKWRFYRTLFVAWRMIRKLETSREELRAFSCNVIVEREDSASYIQRCAAAEKAGLPKPAQRTGFEVAWWKDSYEANSGKRSNGESCTKRREGLLEAMSEAFH